MTVRVRVGGEWLDKVGAVSDLKSSTVVRSEGWSGDNEASCTLSIPSNLPAAWLIRGALFEIIEAGARMWGGRLTEPKFEGDRWTLTAFGFGAAAEETLAMTGATAPFDPSSIPDDVLDHPNDPSNGRGGFPLERHSQSFGTTAVSATQGEALTISAVLDEAVGEIAGNLYDTTGETLAHYWHVDSFGELSLLVEPTEPTWATTPGAAYLGTTDEEFVTSLNAYFVSSLDANGQPNGWTFTGFRHDNEAIAKYGRIEATVDLTAQGLLNSTQAGRKRDGRFPRVAVRMGYVDGLTLTESNLRRPGFGAGNPMHVRAGEMLLIPGTSDYRTSPTARASVRIVLGEVVQFWGEGRAEVTPVGFIPRNFAGALKAEARKRKKGRHVKGKKK